MRLTFNEYVEHRNYEAEMLAEKQIMYSGKKYGQIVFLAGGAGSGKGFAINNFMPGSDFKIRDVDELKIAFQKLDSLNKFTLEDLMKKYGDKMSSVLDITYRKPDSAAASVMVSLLGAQAHFEGVNKSKKLTQPQKPEQPSHHANAPRPSNPHPPA
jgi:hypothetical protein